MFRDKSLMVICRNEAGLVYNFLAQHAPFFQQVVIVDDMSTDGTLNEVNRFAGDHKSVRVDVYQRPLGGDFSAQRNFGLSKCVNQWCVIFDVDELWPLSVLRNLDSVIAKAEADGIDALVFPRWNFVDGVQWDNEPDYVAALVNRDRCVYSGEIHEFVVSVDGRDLKVGRCDMWIIHWKTSQRQSSSDRFYYDNFDKQREIKDAEMVTDKR